MNHSWTNQRRTQPLLQCWCWEGHCSSALSHSLVSINYGEPWELPAFNQYHQNQMTNYRSDFNFERKERRNLSYKHFSSRTFLQGDTFFLGIFRTLDLLSPLLVTLMVRFLYAKENL
ncbi:hypothetical protein PRUPE_1G553400 [Prunus persica]|uniref:Uncharacterized protein n=1 Tax=Prunus persica TaxID=3760 RepID=A0A251RIA7_PRUPE|nr:hypothetical protein PRUPE_1G553400 [Prunus persica]